MIRLYGTPNGMTFDEFKSTEWFQRALDDVSEAKTLFKENKEKRIRENEAKGVAHPGPKQPKLDSKKNE